MKHRYLFGLCIGWVIVCLYFFQVIYSEVKDKAIEELNSRQRIHARQAAKGIESFFEHWIALLESVAASDHVIAMDKDGERELAFVLQTNSYEIKGISRIDKHGRIAYTVPYAPEYRGADISGQKHVVKVMNTQKPVISDVFTLVQGYRGITLHVPVFKDQNFEGTLAAIFNFETVLKDFLGDIHLGQTGYAWMIDSEGTEIYCPVPGHIGKSVYENTKGFPTLQALANEMLQGHEGTTTYIFNRIRDQQNGPVKKHAFYMPIRIGDNRWSVVVASVEDEVLASLVDFKTKLLFLLGLLLLGCMLFSYYGMRAWGIVRESEKRRSIENHLREAEERCRTLLGRAPDAFFAHDLDGRFLEVNEQACQSIGYSREELLGMRMQDVEANLNPDRLQKAWQAVAGGETVSIEGIHRRKDGSTFPVEVRIGLFRKNESVMIFGFARDLTLRNQTENELRKRESALKSILRAAPVGIGVVAERVFQQVNDKICEMTGFAREELIGKNARLLYPSDEEYDFVGRDKYEQIRAKGTGWVETNWRRKDGKIIDIILSSAPLDNNDLSAGVTFSALDITERKRAERELRTSEEKFRLLVENQTDLIVKVDPRGNFLFVSPSYCKMFGLTENELLDRPFMPLVHPEDRESTARALENINQPPYSVYLEQRAQAKNGWRWLGWACSAVLDAQNKVIAIDAVGRDITEKKNAENALKESELKFRELAELMPETIYEIDSAGTLVFVNRNAFENFGYTQADVDRGLNAFDLIDPEDRPRAMENARRVMAGEKLGLNEYSAKRRDGSTFPALFCTTAIVRDGKPFGLRGFSINIAERKRFEEEKRELESQLRQAQKMEAIGTLAGGIAHDFNNILFAILGYAEMIYETAEAESFLQKASGEILTAGRRARDLVKQILTFSRESIQERRSLRIEPIIKETLQLLRSTLPATIEVRQDIDSVGAMVMADPTQIHQIVMNLATNAYHAMETKGGTLTVGLTQLDLGPGALLNPGMVPGPYIRLTVSDTGQGIDKAVLDRIFEPYFTTKKNGKGTGLGLSVVHGIVKSYRGGIEVHSDPGKGSTFSIYLPEQKTTEKTELSVPSSPLERGTERILLVDDEEPITAMVKEMLTRLGYKVATRTSSVDALEAFRNNPNGYDLVITDQTMPNMTGDRLVRAMLEIRPDVPIVLCTGFSENIDDASAKAMGIKAFVLKPIVLSDISRIIRQVLEGR